MSAPLPVGPAINAAGKIGRWLLDAHEEEKETSVIVRQALRFSICRYDPYAPGVDQLAEKIERRMWELAKVAPKRAGALERVTTRLRAAMPKVGKRVKEDALDFPQWRDELEKWVALAAAGVDFQAADVTCRSRPLDAATLADRFPAMFHLEVGATWRMSPFRARLLDRLKAADDRRGNLTRAFGDSQLWLTGVYGFGAAAAGLGLAEIAEWSDPGLVAGIGGVAGLVYGLIQGRSHGKLTAEQANSRASIHQWIYIWLRLRTQAPKDELTLLMLQQAIEEDSAKRYSTSILERVVAAKQRGVISEDASGLQKRLRWDLIPAAAAANDSHIVAALRSLDAALDEENAELAQADEVFACLHRLMVAVELAPALAEPSAAQIGMEAPQDQAAPESIESTRRQALRRRSGRHRGPTPR